ncbi:amino acid ABC transporter permease [Candidatus Dependentiae bacterium]|nr:amino acid ABC transporter permease [Candidatus Dependentiae bacterium]
MISLLFLQEYFPLFLKGLFVSLQIAFYSCFIGAMFGLLFGVIISQKIKIIYKIVKLYVVVIRGTPMLIQITATYYLFAYAGLSISSFWSAVFSIGLNSAAYVSQIVVAGINAVGVGQIEAAKVLGFNRTQIILFIIFPQMIRVVLPTLGNELVTLIKDSSLASTIGVYELSKQGSIIACHTYNIPAVYLIMGAIYLVVTSFVSGIISLLEKRMQYYVTR